MNKKRALFLDRDGIINLDKGYVYKREDFIFKDEIFDLAEFFQNKGYLIIVITNQSGIGRGLYSEEDFLKLTEWMISVFADKNIVIHDVNFSPYHPVFGVGKYRSDSYSRKPNPGMIIEAGKEFDIDLGESILVGDKFSDVQAGLNAGIKNNFLLSKDNSEVKADMDFIIVNSLKEIINFF